MTGGVNASPEADMREDGALEMQTSKTRNYTSQDTNRFFSFSLLSCSRFERLPQNGDGDEDASKQPTWGNLTPASPKSGGVSLQGLSLGPQPSPTSVIVSRRRLTIRPRVSEKRQPKSRPYRKAEVPKPKPQEGGPMVNRHHHHLHHHLGLPSTTNAPHLPNVMGYEARTGRPRGALLLSDLI